MGLWTNTVERIINRFVDKTETCYQENIVRGVSPVADNSKKTHCKHGHELAGDNLYEYVQRMQRMSKERRSSKQG